MVGRDERVAEVGRAELEEALGRAAAPGGAWPCGVLSAGQTQNAGAV